MTPPSVTPQGVQYIFTDRYWSESLSYMENVEQKVVRAADYDAAVERIEKLELELAEARRECKAAKSALRSVRDCPTTTCGSCKAIIYSVLNVAGRQPDKDANDGSR